MADTAPFAGPAEGGAPLQRHALRHDVLKPCTLEQACIQHRDFSTGVSIWSDCARDCNVETEKSVRARAGDKFASNHYTYVNVCCLKHQSNPI